jgi:hypothetical protein
MAEYLGVPVKILRLPKYSPPESVRKQRGIFPGGTFWRRGAYDGLKTTKNTKT